MADKKEIKFSIDKNKALKIAKKAATGKFAMMSDNGFSFKVGAPMMTALVEVEDGVIYVSGKGPGGTVANTVYGDISSAIEEAEEANQSAPAAAPAQAVASVAPVSAPVQKRVFSLDEFEKSITLISKMKEMVNNGALTEEEFSKFKQKLLDRFEESSPVVQPQVVAAPVEAPAAQPAPVQVEEKAPEETPSQPSEPIVVEEPVKEESTPEVIPEVVNEPEAKQVSNSELQNKKSDKYVGGIILSNLFSVIAAILFFVLFGNIFEYFLFVSTSYWYCLIYLAIALIAIVVDIIVTIILGVKLAKLKKNK